MQFEVNRADFHETRAVTRPPRRPVDTARTAAGPDSAHRRAIRTHHQQHHLRRCRRHARLLGLLPYEPGAIDALGPDSGDGARHVAESAHHDIAVGGRYFGFYPMASDVVIDAAPHGSAFRDVGPHRAEHAATYTDFRDVTTDVMFRPEQADEYLLLWGVFMTSFLVDDYLADNDFLGATQTLVTSASSKTSICLAQCLAERDGHRGIGLTSERNRVFVEGLGLYDEVITYDEVDQLDPSSASTMVDMAGSGSLRAAIHTHFADALNVSLTVGATHWQDRWQRRPAARTDTRVLLRPRTIREARGRLGRRRTRRVASPDLSTSSSTPPMSGSRLNVEAGPRA